MGRKSTRERSDLCVLEKVQNRFQEAGNFSHSRRTKTPNVFLLNFVGFILSVSSKVFSVTKQPKTQNNPSLFPFIVHDLEMIHGTDGVNEKHEKEETRGVVYDKSFIVI